MPKKKKFSLAKALDISEASIEKELKQFVKFCRNKEFEKDVGRMPKTIDDVKKIPAEKRAEALVCYLHPQTHPRELEKDLHTSDLKEIEEIAVSDKSKSLQKRSAKKYLSIIKMVEDVGVIPKGLKFYLNNHYLTKDIFEVGIGVCRAFTVAYKILAERIDIDCTLVVTPFMEHLTSFVRINKKKFLADPGWDIFEEDEKDYPPLFEGLLEISDEDEYLCLNASLEKNPAERLKMYDEILQKKNCKKDPMMWLNKGVSLTELNRNDEAITCFDKAIELNPNYAKVWFSKALTLIDLFKSAEALECYSKAIELNPDYEEAWFNKGILLSNFSKHEDALACFDKAIELNPKYAPNWCQKGVAFTRLNKCNDALKCYNKAIELNPEYAKAWFNKAVSLEALGRFTTAAIEAYKKAKKLFVKQDKVDLAAEAEKNIDQLKKRIS